MYLPDIRRRWFMRQELGNSLYHGSSSVAVREHCICAPLSRLPAESQEDTWIDDACVVPASARLCQQLRAALGEFVLCSEQLSVLLFHVVQRQQTFELEHDHIVRHCTRYHAHSGVLEQVLTNVRRVLRSADQFLFYEESGAAIILPNVGRWEVEPILDRVYNSVGLLQAETIVPPLTEETLISIGAGSYPDPATTLEELLRRTGTVARSLTLRPRINAQPSVARCCVDANEHVQSAYQTAFFAESSCPQVPFMELPRRVPQRLAQLLPHEVALRYRCVPVGRDQHRLTVAMSNPLDTEHVKQLCELTGMNIFPVSCKEEDLNVLLKRKW